MHRQLAPPSCLLSNAAIQRRSRARMRPSSCAPSPLGLRSSVARIPIGRRPDGSDRSQAEDCELPPPTEIVVRKVSRRCSEFRNSTMLPGLLCRSDSAVSPYSARLRPAACGAACCVAPSAEADPPLLGHPHGEHREARGEDPGPRGEGRQPHRRDLGQLDATVCLRAGDRAIVLLALSLEGACLPRRSPH